MRNGGPRQPGGGRQTAGPRQRGRPQRDSDRPHQGGRAKAREQGEHPRRGRASAAPGQNRTRNKRPPQGERRPPAPPPRILQPIVEAPPLPELPTAVQTVTITPDEANMRVDRFLEARFPGLSFSHIQRIVRKGELRVNGKRVDSKDRLQAGQAVRIPPLRLDPDKPRSPASEADDKTRDFLKSITLYEDAD